MSEIEIDYGPAFTPKNEVYKRYQLKIDGKYIQDLEPETTKAIRGLQAEVRDLNEHREVIEKDNLKFQAEVERLREENEHLKKIINADVLNITVEEFQELLNKEK